MSDRNLDETLQVKACPTCGAGLLETDRYCRWCGRRQTGRAEPSSKGDCQGDRMETVGEAVREPAAYVTSTLQLRAVESDRYHSVSAPLVDALATGMAGNEQPLLCTGLVRKTLATLMAVPIWLILVLLSPLDAFVAAKSVSKSIKCGQRPRSFYRARTLSH